MSPARGWWLAVALLAALAAGQDPADNVIDGAPDVEATVEEVQRRLKEDPTLPRLTREQIEGLIQEVTHNETADTNRSSERDDRSLLLVMSHSAANMSGEKLQSLYTQPPVTRVIPDELLVGEREGDSVQYRTPVPPPQRRRPTTSAPPTPTGLLTNHRPFYAILDDKEEQPEPTEVKPEDPPAPARLPEDNSVTPKLPDADLATTAPETTPQPSRRRPTPQYEGVSRKKAPAKRRRPQPTTTSRWFEPTVAPSPGTVRAEEQIIFDSAWQPPETPRPTPGWEQSPTPLPYSRRRPQPQVTTTQASGAGAQEGEAETTPRPVRRRRPQGSASAGRKPTPHDSADLVATVEEYFLGDAQQPGWLPRTVSSPRMTTTTTTTTTTAAPPTAAPATSEEPLDVAAAASALSPAVRDFLESLGLLAPAAPATLPPPPPEPTLAPPNPEPFRAFRPLPQSRAQPAEDDMRQLLASFGLIDEGDSARSGKALQEDNTTAASEEPKVKTEDDLTDIETSMLTDDQTAVLRNLGLLDDRPETDQDYEEDSVQEASAAVHVFSPSRATPSPEDGARLQAVLESVRNFSDGPDPLDADNGDTKNEVKRQLAPADVEFLEPVDNGTTATTTTESTAEEVTDRANRTAEDEARVKALSESFGGPGDAGDLPSPADVDEYDDSDEGEEIGAPRPNGLYFLVDWNSFLAVGEGDNPRVNLRLAPKAGDPRNFLRVTVP